MEKALYYVQYVVCPACMRKHCISCRNYGRTGKADTLVHLAELFIGGISMFKGRSASFRTSCVSSTKDFPFSL